MPKVKFTHALKRFFPTIKELDIEAGNISNLMEQLETHYPGIASYILDDQGSLREHVNIFVDGDLIYDRKSLTDLTQPESEVYIMQALSGG
jgi:hypothetical protein